MNSLGKRYQLFNASPRWKRYSARLRDAWCRIVPSRAFLGVDSVGLSSTDSRLLAIARTIPTVVTLLPLRAKHGTFHGCNLLENLSVPT